MSDMPVDEPVDPTRSRIMRAIRGKDTKPEMAVRRLAHSMGYRFRLHARDLPGRPDLVFRRRRKAIFVHGCFWHRHDGCRKSSVPATRTEWWADKLGRNVQRDRRAVAHLSEMGWESMTIWECEIADRRSLEEKVRRFLGPSGSYPLQSFMAVDSPPSNVGFGTPLEADGQKTAKDGSRDRQERGSNMATKQKSTKGSSKGAAADETGAAAAATDIGTKKKALPKSSQTSTTKTSAPGKAAAKTAGTSSTKSAKTPANAPTGSSAKSPAKGTGKKSASKKAASKKSASPGAQTSQPTHAQGQGTQSAPAAQPAQQPPAAEHTLPKRYSATTNTDAGTVTVTRGTSSATIRMQSFASVANVLAMLEEGSHGVLEPTAHLEITDHFSGKKASITAESLTDVAAVLTGLAQGAVGEAGTEASAPDTAPPEAAAAAPETPAPTAEAQPAAPAPAKQSTAKPQPTKAATKKAAQPKQATAKAPAKSVAKAPAKAAAKAPAKATKSSSKQTAKATPTTASGPSAMPDWLSALKEEYVSEAGNYRLIRAELALDPSAPAKAHKVAGRWGDSEGKHSWGYEILSDGKHVAWVIAEDQRTFILTGALNYTPSVHRMIEGLMARVTSTVMPQFAKAA